MLDAVVGVCLVVCKAQIANSFVWPVCLALFGTCMSESGEWTRLGWSGDGVERPDRDSDYLRTRSEKAAKSKAHSCQSGRLFTHGISIWLEKSPLHNASEGMCFSGATPDTPLIQATECGLCLFKDSE